MIRRLGMCAASALLVLSLVADRGRCAPPSMTPLSWQHTIDSSAVSGDPVFFHQKKNTTWIRDANRNFVDDLIDRMPRTDTVNVILDLNHVMSAPDIQTRFGGFGRVQYVGRFLTVAFLEDVRVSRLDSLAQSSDVAMVEWQVPVHLALVYSTREIQARSTTTYHQYSSSAQSRGQIGTGVGIAILDTGVDEGHASIPNAVHGFDALKFEDTNGNGRDDSCEGSPLGDGSCTGSDDEPGDGTTNPDPCAGGTCQKHGTYVAGVALGQGYDDPNDDCGGPTTPNDEKGLTANCTGTAVGANLIDVRVCPDDVSDCSLADVVEGLEWVAANAASLGIRVANLSFVVCADDDPTGMLPSLVDFVVQSGVVVVAGHGNQGKCSTSNPPCDAAHPLQRSLAPGVAPMALTVSATYDKNTIKRRDDAAYSGALEGPRCGFNASAPQPDRAYLKPDLAAPGQGIWVPKAGTTTGYEPVNGTSLAAPHAAGAAAIVLGANHNMAPADVCDLLMRTAESPRASSPYNTSVDPKWSKLFGMGILNVDGALGAMNVGDVAFPGCTGDPGQPGSPCLLASPHAPWENDIDIRTDVTPPVAGGPNRIHATIVNRGPKATIDVDFGLYPMGSGVRPYDHIGRVRAIIPAGSTVDVAQDWIPSATGSQVLQAAIRYGSDTVFWNNVTQRTVSVQPPQTMSYH